MSDDVPLPDELQYLKNLIGGAKNEPNYCEMTLRDIIRDAADAAPTAHVIRLAETILQCGIDIERSKWCRRN